MWSWGLCLLTALWHLGPLFLINPPDIIPIYPLILTSSPSLHPSAWCASTTQQKESRILTVSYGFTLLLERVALCTLLWVGWTFMGLREELGDWLNRWRMFGCLAALSSGFTPRYSEERKKEGKKLDMAVEEGAVSLTRVSIHIYFFACFFFFSLYIWHCLLFKSIRGFWGSEFSNASTNRIALVLFVCLRITSQLICNLMNRAQSMFVGGFHPVCPYAHTFANVHSWFVWNIKKHIISYNNNFTFF